MKLEHLMQKVRAAAESGIGTMSTGEALFAALVLNRHDWLARMDYTIAEALDRIDDDMVPLISHAAKQWARENERSTQARRIATEEVAAANLLNTDSPDETIDFASELVTYGSAPGYRDASLVFDVRRIGEGVSKRQFRIDLRVRPQDAETIVRHLLEVHRLAWSRKDADGRPLDAKTDEHKPRWIEGSL